MGKYYEQLSLSERVYIQAQLELGFKAAAIAAALNRHPSTPTHAWLGAATVKLRFKTLGAIGRSCRLSVVETRKRRLPRA